MKKSTIGPCPAKNSSESNGLRLIRVAAGGEKGI